MDFKKVFIDYKKGKKYKKKPELIRILEKYREELSNAKDTNKLESK